MVQDLRVRKVWCANLAIFSSQELLTQRVIGSTLILQGGKVASYW